MMCGITGKATVVDGWLVNVMYGRNIYVKEKDFIESKPLMRWLIHQYENKRKKLSFS